LKAASLVTVVTSSSSPLGGNKVPGWQQRWDACHAVHFTSLQPLRQSKSIYILLPFCSYIYHYGGSIDGLHDVHALVYVSWDITDGGKHVSLCSIWEWMGSLELPGS
jgi:hypothetical protein